LKEVIAVLSEEELLTLFDYMNKSFEIIANAKPGFTLPFA